MWPLLGAIQAWILATIGRFRANGENVEYSIDNVTWLATAGRYVKYSSTLQNSFDTERNTGAVDALILIGRVVPNFTGQIKLSVQLKRNSGTGIARVSTSTSPYDGFAIGAIVSTAPITTATFANSTSASYATFTTELAVQRGVPISVLLGKTTTGDDAYAKELRYYYSDITATVVG